MKWLKIMYNIAGVSCFLFGHDTHEKNLWNENNMEITWGLLSPIINGTIFTKVL